MVFQVVIAIAATDVCSCRQGHRGQDATRYSSGTNGGRGGDGGDGGEGSSGSDGGAGGMIRVACVAGDEYLLMAVDGLEEPSHLVEGGPGGRPGHHGRGGSGGPGGPGGSGYSWTESHQRSRQGPNGTEYYTETTSHHNSGGFSGTSTGQ